MVENPMCSVVLYKTIIGTLNASLKQHDDHHLRILGQEWSTSRQEKRCLLYMQLVSGGCICHRIFYFSLALNLN